MPVANRVIKNTIWLYVKVGVQLFTTLWATRIVLNTLGASDFGIFNIVGGAIAMLGFLNGRCNSAFYVLFRRGGKRGKTERDF